MPTAFDGLSVKRVFVLQLKQLALVKVVLVKPRTAALAKDAAHLRL